MPRTLRLMTFLSRLTGGVARRWMRGARPRWAAPRRAAGCRRAGAPPGRTRAARARAAGAGRWTGRGSCRAAIGDVVEARDRDLAGHVDPERGQPRERAEREQVVGARDRGERRRRAARSASTPSGPALAVERGVDDEALVEREVRVRQAAAVAGEPLARDVQERRAGEERDPPVAEGRERADHRRDPARVVDADLRLARARAARGGRPRRRRRASRRGGGRSPR